MKNIFHVVNIMRTTPRQPIMRLALLLFAVMALPTSAAFGEDIRINAGGGGYTDTVGNLWSADTGYNTGTVYSSLDSIANTTDGPLYQSERWDDISAPELEYIFSVTNGEYTVKLHFSDQLATGKRLFDVDVEGQLVLKNLDVSGEAGINTALVKSFPVTVNDGQLNIRFLHGIQNPKINAIEVLSQSSALAPPPPSGLCISSGTDNKCASMPQQSFAFSAPTGQAGLFPGTNLKFYPGIVVWTTQNEAPSSIESKWQQLFTSSQNRKVSYRPPGVFGGVFNQLGWRLFYKDPNVRPTQPKNHTDPAYDWSRLDAVFNINAVQNEGALVALYPGEAAFSGKRAPDWLSNAPYNGTFDSGIDGGSNQTRTTPKYYRYAGANNIVDEIAYFHRALHDHLVATGNIDKVMFVRLSEAFVSSSNLPSDYNSSDFYKGIGLRNKLLASIWAESQIFVTPDSIVGPSRNIVWEYMDNPIAGMSFPDMKMSGTNNISAGGNRFSRPDGSYQKNVRLLSQSTESNGHRVNTYFAPGIPNPWGYSNQAVPQTASHILWALSGEPKGENKDSGLGQAGDDPPGIMPVHVVYVDWSTTWGKNNPTLQQWQYAIDTFGPPGTFAFPYLPPGYNY